MIKTNELKQFLESLKKEDFWNENRIQNANTIDDLKKFGYEGFLNGDTIVNFGEYFLVDYYGNDLTICILTKKKYKNNKGRTVACKPFLTIIEDCKKQYGSCINGYFLIEERFIV